ncbi:MAG: flagellar biosynthetic protein FliO [Gammaproteobacteria bacterium]|nr:flagellar biosynthetic protein FliO [Gammaproteobacteria bacterium]
MAKLFRPRPGDVSSFDHEFPGLLQFLETLRQLLAADQVLRIVGCRVRTSHGHAKIAEAGEIRSEIPHHARMTLPLFDQLDLGIDVEHHQVVTRRITLQQVRLGPDFVRGVSGLDVDCRERIVVVDVDGTFKLVGVGKQDVDPATDKVSGARIRGLG